MSKIDYCVDVDYPLPEYNNGESGELYDRIGAHIAGMIKDGDCLQLGIGAIPNGVLPYLTRKKDIGIHTELFSDGVIDLVEKGVINGERKNVHPGKIVAGFCLGTRKLYDWVHDNAMCEFRPTEYVNDSLRVSQNDNMVAINSAIEVDLTGQVCADSPMARVRMSALALCVQIQQQVGIESIVHFTTRDRSLMGLQADLIGAHALGVRNILALTGDPPSLGDTRQSTAVYDVDSIGLVRIIHRFNDGVDVAGQEMGQKGGFTIAVACDPTRSDLAQEVDRFHQKVSGGAHFTMTQPIFDPQLWVNFVEVYEARHGQFPVPVLIGVLPLQGHKHATFLHNEVPGITLSAGALERMRLAGANGRQEGVKMAQELLLELKELPYVQGVYLMPSFGRYETACQVLEVIPAQAR